MSPTPLWLETREHALADMNAKANEAGCICTAVPFVVSEVNTYPIRVRMTHMTTCPVAVAKRAEER